MFNGKILTMIDEEISRLQAARDLLAGPVVSDLPSNIHEGIRGTDKHRKPHGNTKRVVSEKTRRRLSQVMKKVWKEKNGVTKSVGNRGTKKAAMKSTEKTAEK